MDGDSDWTKANDICDGAEEGYDSPRDEISSASSYNPMKESAHKTFENTLSLQSFAARSSFKEVSYFEGGRAGLSSIVAPVHLSVAEVLDDSIGGVLSPKKLPATHSLRLQRKLSIPLSTDDAGDGRIIPPAPRDVEPAASEGFIRKRSYNIKLDDQILLRFSPKNSDSTYYFGDMTGKSTFVEHRTFFHLYRSFHRLWIFLVLMFQALTIIAWGHEGINLDTFKIVLSIGATFVIMNFIENVLLMFGAYTTARGMAISRLVIRFFWFGLTYAFVTYIYLKVLQERNDQNSNSFYFRIYILVLGVYAALRLVFALLLQFPACHALSEMSNQSFFQFFKWIYEVSSLNGARGAITGG